MLIYIELSVCIVELNENNSKDQNVYATHNGIIKCIKRAQNDLL